MPPLTEARTLLYVISCRKPDGEYQKISRLRPNKREAHLHAPKRAGTYALLTAPYKADLQEEDLTAVVDRETGLPLDTDFRERTAGRPDLAADWEAIRRRHPQDQVEDRIAAYVWNLGKPIVLFLHGYNVTPGGALQSGWALQEHLDRTGVGATVVVFRWPSNGHLLDYFPDQQAAGRFGSYALVNAVMSLRRTAGAPGMLHCLAHSMGTYVVTRALGTIAILQMQRFLPVPEAETILDEVVLMQPDIDFDCLCSGYVGPAWESPSYLEIPDGYAATKLARRLTIYCTTNDVALFASLFKNRTKRLGAYGPGLETRLERKQLMDEKVRDNVYVVNCDDWCLFDFTSRHSHSHFLDCPCMMDDVAGALAGTAAGANPARVPLGAPRWYQLTYPRPGPLPAMATLWKTIGALAINAPMMALVKAKKRIQLTLRVLQALTPFLPLVGSFVLGSLWADSPLGLALMLGSAAALLAYGLAWVFGWAVQRREDAACGAVPSQGLPVPQPAAPAPHEETIFERNMRNLKTFFSNRPRLKP